MNSPILLIRAIIAKVLTINVRNHFWIYLNCNQFGKMGCNVYINGKDLIMKDLSYCRLKVVVSWCYRFISNYILLEYQNSTNRLNGVIGIILK